LTALDHEVTENIVFGEITATSFEIQIADDYLTPVLQGSDVVYGKNTPVLIAVGNFDEGRVALSGLSGYRLEGALEDEGVADLMRNTVVWLSQQPAESRDRYVSDIADLQEQVDQLRIESNSLQNEINSLEQQKMQISSEIENLELTRDAPEETVQPVTATPQTSGLADGEKAAFQSQIAQLESDKQRLSSEVSALKQNTVASQPTGFGSGMNVYILGAAAAGIAIASVVSYRAGRNKSKSR
jgi:hypothetical protein